MSTELAKQQTGEVVQHAVTLAEAFVSMARDPSIDVARIRELMELQKWSEERTAEKEFIAAMNRLQPKLPRIAKRGSVDYGSADKKVKFKFSTYEDVDREVRPLLEAEGFSLSYGTQPLEKGGIIITLTLSHAAGHSRTNSMPLPFDTSGGKNAIQAVGSSLTYGKRYLLCAMLNIVSEGEDDDGTSIDYITVEQQHRLEEKMSDLGMNEVSKQKMLETLDAKSLGDIRKGAYQVALNLLAAKGRKVDGK